MAKKLKSETEEAGKAVRHACDLTFEQFLRAYPTAPDYLWGRHTRALAEEMQLAVEAAASGRNYYALISVPPRHGKSDQVSRRLPAFILCRNPDLEIILASYSGKLSEELSIAARRCFAEAGPLYDLALSEELNQKGCWRVDDHRGGMFAVGLGGTITGRGAHVLIVDDYCKNREEAESAGLRDKVWDSFRNDLMTRLAPAHIVIVVATRWHEDDLAGRILVEMERDEKFPRFCHINFPAWTEAGTNPILLKQKSLSVPAVATHGGEQQYSQPTDMAAGGAAEGLPCPPRGQTANSAAQNSCQSPWLPGWLFPERFSAAWYESQRAAVGSYAWQSLYQGDPRPRTGRLLKAEQVQIVEKMPADLRWVRGWDLASTEKERLKDDPDYTTGTLAAFDGADLWIADVVRGQWTATERDKRMVASAKADGSAVKVVIEAVGGYKDTFINIKAALNGLAEVRKTTTAADKVARACNLEPLFESGRVHILKAPWNNEWLAEFSAFPKGKHDDQVDSLVIAAGEAVNPHGRLRFTN
jgi:predicted phage terminase large subunit-like protein